MSPVTQALGLWGPWTSGIHSHLRVTWLGTVTRHWKHEHRGRRLCALPRPALGSGLPPARHCSDTVGTPQGVPRPTLRAEAAEQVGGHRRGGAPRGTLGLKPAGRGPQPTSHLPKPQLCWPHLKQDRENEDQSAEAHCDPPTAHPPGGPGSGEGVSGEGSHFLSNEGPRSSPNRKPAQDGARSWILTEMPLREEERTRVSDHRAAATRQAGGRSSGHLDPRGWPCQELSPSSAVTHGTHSQDETRQGGEFAWTHTHLLPDNLENDIKVPIPKTSQCSFSY